MSDKTVVDYKESAIQQYDTIISLIKKTFEDDKASKIVSMYEEYKDIMIDAPASSKVFFHNCYPGGYLDHIFNVVNFGVKIHKIFKEDEYPLNYDKSELVFALLHHDFGKIADENKNAYYIKETSQWHIDRGIIYKKNPKVSYMPPPDRALFLLQHYKIPVTSNEWVAIKASDGLYDKSNENYLISYNKDANSQDHSIMMHVVHWAGHMASQYEHGMYLNSIKNDK